MFCRRGESAYAAVFFPYRGKYISFDEEGTELPDLNAVRAEAIRTAGEMLRDAGFVRARTIRATVNRGACGSRTGLVVPARRV
jgi:hypothetical protein